jgi:predicted  nucleic acid-binding Zn ribbon protein
MKTIKWIGKEVAQEITGKSVRTINRFISEHKTDGNIIKTEIGVTLINKEELVEVFGRTKASLEVEMLKEKIDSLTEINILLKANCLRYEGDIELKNNQLRIQNDIIEKALPYTDHD